MVGKWLNISLLVLYVLVFTGIINTQESKAQESDSIVGFWKQTKDSVYINITESNGVIEAEMVRNDWTPALVGKKVFQNVTLQKKNRWLGQSYILGSEDLGVVRIKLKNGEELETRMRPGKKQKWARTEPIKKRY